MTPTEIVAYYTAPGSKYSYAVIDEKDLKASIRALLLHVGERQGTLTTKVDGEFANGYNQGVDDCKHVIENMIKELYICHRQQRSIVRRVVTTVRQ